MTQLKALRKQQQAKLEKTMLGEDSDEEDEKEERGSESSQNVDMSCSWGMGEYWCIDELIRLGKFFLCEFSVSTGIEIPVGFQSIQSH